MRDTGSHCPLTQIPWETLGREASGQPGIFRVEDKIMDENEQHKVTQQVWDSAGLRMCICPTSERTGYPMYGTYLPFLFPSAVPGHGEAFLAPRTPFWLHYFPFPQDAFSDCDGHREKHASHLVTERIFMPLQTPRKPSA